MAFGSFSLAIVGLVVRTVHAGMLSDVASRGAFIPLVVLLAGAVAWMTVHRVQDAWGRVAAASFVLLFVAGVVARLRSPAQLELGRATAALVSPPPAVHGIVLVTIDTMRRDRASIYGHAPGLTPSLEQFAERSIVFENAYANAPYTLPSHASLFTGLLPSEHGAHLVVDDRRDRPLAGRYRVLAEELAARGYQTGGIAANVAYLGPWTGLSRGFSAYVASAEFHVGYYPLALPLLARIVPRWRMSAARTWSADAITDAAIRWLARSDSKPFFLFLNYMDVHQYLERAGTIGIKRLVDATPSERLQYARHYDEAVRIADDGLGRLLAWMSNRPTFDQTLIVITSDHGEYLGERGLWGHGHELHEPVLRVPLVVKFPGKVPPGRTRVRINHAQLHTLILDAVHGKALSETLPKPSSEAQVVAESWQVWTDSLPQRTARRPWRAARAVYADTWKLIERVGGVPSELYDLAGDPDETVNLFVAEPELAAQRAAVLTKGLPPIDPADASAGHATPLSPEAAEQLRALGYTGP
jgi:arylsulfatase A-like enzyme